MASRNNKTGLLALIGIAAGGAFAWWKYNTASPEEKAKIKEKISQTGSKIKDAYADVEDTVSGNYNKLKDNVKKEAEKLNG
ncbi:MAG: YtxH domain-containing protein [Leeuwenhoekiella sp.]